MDRRRFGLALGLILLYMFGGMALGRLLPSAGDDLGDRVSLTLGAFAVLFLIVIGITRNWRFVGLVGRDQKPAVRWIVVLFVLQFLTLALYALVSSTEWTGGTGRMAFVLVNVAFVAFNEEVLFRGFLWGSTGGWSPVKRILFVSALFGLFHLGNLLGGDALTATLMQVVFTFLAGILDAVIRYGTGSLWPTILTHFLWDAGGILGKGGFADSIGPIIQGITVLVGLIALAGVAVHQRRAAQRAVEPAVAT